MGPLTTHFKRRSGKTSHYREFLFFDDGNLCIVGYCDAHVSRPFRVNGELVFDKSFKAFRIQEKGDTFTTIAVYGVDDRFLGYYSDATMPWAGVRKVGPGRYETDIDDLYLDHFIFADGRAFVMDFGELSQGLAARTISPAEAELSLETISLLHEGWRDGSYPQAVIGNLTLDPALLSDLPVSQE
jgi:predicted RNA-binding protein associated with RNAse of E/G family